LNLSLQLLAKRDDGYHELETLMVPIRLYDTVHIERLDSETSLQLSSPRTTPEAAADSSANSSPAAAGCTGDKDPASTVSLRCSWAPGLSAKAELPLLPQGDDNLASRAARLLASASGQGGAVEVTIVKRIPAAAGLGGASSDAAGVLLCLNQLWRLHWPIQRLMALAAELGSDVPFFLAGCPAICRGRGEQVLPVRLPRLHFVVAKPKSGLSTAAVYAGCRIPPAARRRPAAERLLAAVRQGLAPAAAEIANDLQASARGLSPEVDATLRLLQPLGLARQMSGSGTACFAWCRNAPGARQAARKLAGRFAGSVLATATI
jgi:4-diphosphocytidyl-2-C-methyl-D-erythritol kinase